MTLVEAGFLFYAMILFKGGIGYKVTLMTDPKKETPLPETPKPAPAAPEYGGRKGPEPVRYGDWEKDGKCVDF